MLGRTPLGELAPFGCIHPLPASALSAPSLFWSQQVVSSAWSGAASCSRRAGIKPQTRLLLCFLPLPFLPPAQGFHWDSLGWKLREFSAGAALRFLMLEESRGSLFVFHPLCQNISGCSVEGAVIPRFLAVSRVIRSSCSPAWLLQLFQLI